MFYSVLLRQSSYERYSEIMAVWLWGSYVSSSCCCTSERSQQFQLGAQATITAPGRKKKAIGSHASAVVGASSASASCVGTRKKHSASIRQQLLALHLPLHPVWEQGKSIPSASPPGLHRRSRRLHPVWEQGKSIAGVSYIRFSNCEEVSTQTPSDHSLLLLEL